MTRPLPWTEVRVRRSRRDVPRAAEWIANAATFTPPSPSTTSPRSFTSTRSERECANGVPSRFTQKWSSRSGSRGDVTGDALLEAELRRPGSPPRGAASGAAAAPRRCRTSAGTTPRRWEAPGVVGERSVISHVTRLPRSPLASERMRVAALDLGTNSFHLLVADVQSDGHIDPIVREKEMLRLGDVVSRHGSSRRPPPIRPSPPCGASSSSPRPPSQRDPRLGDQRHPRGRQRRRRGRPDRGDRRRGRGDRRPRGGASHLRGGARSVVLDPPRRHLDLGGGSLEVMVGDARGMHWATSRPLGVARITAEFVHSDPISETRSPCALRDRITDGPRPVAAESSPPSPSWRSGAAARSRPSPHGRGAARRGRAPQPQPAHDHRDEFLVAAQGDHRVRTRPSASRSPGSSPPRRPHRRRSMFLATAMDVFDLDP